MASIAQLISIADAYKALTGIKDDSTVSHRVFRDSKKLGALRQGDADITVRRFNASLFWFRDNWPDGFGLPSILTAALPHEGDDAA